MGFDTSIDIGKDAERTMRAKEQKKRTDSKIEKEPKKGKNVEKKIKKYARHRNYIHPLIILILGLVIFSQTANVPIADKLAQTYSEKAVAQQIYQQVEERQPYLPSERKREIAEQDAKEVFKQQDFKDRVEQEADNIREYYQNPEGTTYLYNYDPYYYLRLAGNYIDNGHFGEYERDDTAYDDKRYAREEKVGFKLPAFLIAGTSYILNPSNPDEEQGAFWMPVIFGILTVIAFFFLAKAILGIDLAFIASIVFILHRGTALVFQGGTTDTQSLNVFWSVLIILFYILLFKKVEELDFSNKKDWSKIIAYTILGLLSYYLFDLTWAGNYYILAVMAGGIAAYLGVKLLKTKGKGKWYTLGGILAAILITILTLKGKLEHIFSRLNIAQRESIYPSAWETIGELQAMSFSTYLNFYGILFLLICIVGFAGLFREQWRKPDEKSVILVWSLMAVIPLMSSRFFMYALPPLAVLFTIGTYSIAKNISKIDIGITSFLKKLTWTSAIVLLYVILAVPGVVSASNQYPYMDDAIYETATEIQLETSNDAIIDTWWDYGYIYQYYADRATTFDGATFVSERLYWLSTTFLEHNQTKASGILRMLNCGGEKGAFKELNKDNTAQESIDTLHKIAGMSKQQASGHVSDEVLQHTHCEEPRPGVLVVSSDMLNKINVFNHFANWDFKYQISITEPIKFQRGNCQTAKNKGICEFGVQYDLNQSEAIIQGVHPKKFIHVNRNFTNKTILEWEDGEDLTILVVENDVFFMESGFENTLLMKALYLNELDNFSLLTMKDMRKRIAAYSVTYP